MLQFLTDGIDDAATSTFLTPNGQHRFYFASDNVYSPAYIVLTPSDLVGHCYVSWIHVREHHAGRSDVSPHWRPFAIWKIGNSAHCIQPRTCENVVRKNDCYFRL